MWLEVSLLRISSSGVSIGVSPVFVLPYSLLAAPFFGGFLFHCGVSFAFSGFHLYGRGVTFGFVWGELALADSLFNPSFLGFSMGEFFFTSGLGLMQVLSFLGHLVEPPFRMSLKSNFERWKEFSCFSLDVFAGCSLKLRFLSLTPLLR